ncbi:MAG: tryptophan synthase subunit alpha [Gemmatimonadota bacterium]
MSGRIAGAFAARENASGRAFIPYVTHGFPSPAATPRLLERLADGGADVVELGVPFSDPLADGPTIQRACQAALRAGSTLDGALELVARQARDLPPVVLFTYLNPVLRMGVERFRDRIADAGVAGVLVTDLPVGSDPQLEARLSTAGPDLIRLVAPTTSPDRRRHVARAASGFLYYISRTGVTGATERLAAGLADEVAALKNLTRLPVAVGFGISRPEQAAAVAAVADGVVVGSALVEALERSEEAFVDLAGSLSEAVHGVA